MEAISKLVLAFVSLVVGLALLSQIASSGQAITTIGTQIDTLDVSTARSNLTLGVNESKTYTALTTYPYANNWKNDFSECRATTITLKNSSGTAYAATTDYVYTAAANTVSLVNGTKTVDGGNSLTVTYSYCPDTYMSQGWSRTTINLVPGLFAIALLGVGVGLFYSLAKDAGIL